ncbi:unnamed protein product [Miscanthus lutarioriparius]|uniref:Protein kinase domain-containing protein n=1 Tax=Miscanthus lutarioriparius TaxID=422564 RepID=A0A811PFP8_9POAL|nr:unnamed protein product [Miscanthus lutarioriparius]
MCTKAICAIMPSVCLLLLSASMLVSTLVTEEDDEEAALLAFKATAISNGHNDPLASWNRSATGGYCSWEGVRCRGTRHRRVVALSLPSHGLTGVLSPAIGNLSSLRTLDLTSNGFSGNIPASLGRLHRLHTLNLTRNAFSGLLPANLSSCTSLMKMVLDFNKLSGNMPSELGDKLKQLKVLRLRNNSFTGRIPASLANLTSLSILDLAFNLLEGTIPNSLGILKDLSFLGLAFNNLSGEPPTSLYNLSSLEMLQIQWNMLSGSIPTDIGSRFPSMRILSLSTNQFTGTIPASLSNLTSLQELHLAQNMLSGYVPRTIGRLRALQMLELYNNMLQANDWEGIPSEISNLVGLEILGIFNTSISGEIPDSIGKLANLTQLGLFNTNLSGQIPSSVGNLTKLAILEAYHANLEGPIPPSIGKSKSIIYLDLSMNRLSGSIPMEIFKPPLLSFVYLDLSYNSLSGPLPSQVGSLVNLNTLVLSGNQLSGKIPESIGECIVLQELWLDNNLFNGSIPQYLNKGLTTLNLSVNKLSGTIPDAIGSISALEQLCLAYNNFSGPIPAVLQNLTSLSNLDLSFNDLQGEVPEEGIFRNLVNLSIIGNNKLCGGVPQLHLVPCKTDSVKKNIRGKLKYLKIALPATFALLLLAIVIALLIYRKQRRKQKGALEPSMVEEQYERVSYHALSNGTNGFSEANLLGKGSFGTVYKCVFQAEGTVVAVKVFDLEQSGSTRSFVAECEALRRVRHRCLMKIITCCSSINEQEDMSARVGDFGISRIISESESMILQNSNSTIGIRGSIGYVAPEYGEGSSITTFGDVYSLGILLLEIFTGRSPTDDMFRGSMDLHKFSEDALLDKIWEIADTTMWLHTGTYDSNTRNIIEKCLVHVISLGVSCSRKQPRERTLIQDAVNEMHAIRDSYLKFARTLVVQDGVGTIFL